MENEETGGIEHGGGESLDRCRPEFAGDPAVARDAVPVGEAVARVLERIEAHLGGASEKRASVLAGGFTNATASRLKIPLFALYTDERLAHLDSGNTSRSTTHEGIEDCLILRSVADAPLHDFERLLRGMIPALRALLTKHSVPHVADQANCFGEIGPCEFAISEVVIAVHLVPDQPALRCRAIVIVAAEDDLPAPSRANLRHNFGINRRVVPIVISVVDGDCQLTTRLGLSSSFTDPIRRISANQIHLAECRQHIPAIAEIQRGATDGFNAGHSGHSQNRVEFSSKRRILCRVGFQAIQPSQSIAAILVQAENAFAVCAILDSAPQAGFQCAGRVKLAVADNHREAARFTGESELTVGQVLAVEHHRLVSAQWRIQRPMQQPRASAVTVQIRIMVVASMGQAAFELASVSASMAALTAIRSREFGVRSPLSHLETVAWFTPILAAIAAWDRPRRLRSDAMSITQIHICAFA